MSKTKKYIWVLGVCSVFLLLMVNVAYARWWVSDFKQYRSWGVIQICKDGAAIANFIELGYEDQASDYLSRELINAYIMDENHLSLERYMVEENLRNGIYPFLGSQELFATKRQTPLIVNNNTYHPNIYYYDVETIHWGNRQAPGTQIIFFNGGTEEGLIYTGASYGFDSNVEVENCSIDDFNFPGESAQSNAYIELNSQLSEANDSWTKIQWADAFGTWHDVTGWQGEVDSDGTKLWWVAPKDYGTGPFIWHLYDASGGNHIASSEEFYLPQANEWKVIEIKSESVADNPSIQYSTIPGLEGGLIELTIEPMQPDIWTQVQWQDTSGTWHDVTGWQGAPNAETGKVTWWVGPDDLGKGPFHWIIFENPGGPQIASSDPFDLPADSGQILYIRSYINN